MKTTHVALLTGLFLGAVLAFGSFADFVLVALCGALGLAVGLSLEGKFDVRDVIDRWKR